MAMCKSCDEQDATVRMRECGLALCTVCYPWVSQSLERTSDLTSDLPHWADTLVSLEPGIFQNVRKRLEDDLILRLDMNVPRPRASTRIPQFDNEWLDYYRWLLGSEHESFKELEFHYFMRSNAGSLGISTVGEIDVYLTNKAHENGLGREAQNIRNWTDEETEWIDEETEWFDEETECVVELESLTFGFEVVFVNSNSFFVDDFAISHHYVKPLAELLFDSMNALDSRVIEERFHVYQNPKGITKLLPKTILPTCPRLREFINQAAIGGLGPRITDLHRATLLYWRFTGEYVTRDVIPWSKSFQFLHSVIASSTRVHANDAGITVRGDSGTTWRVTSNYHRLHWGGNPYGEAFAVYAPNAKKPVCILQLRESHDMPLGDILAAVVMMLLDDIKTSRIVSTLWPYMVDWQNPRC